MVVLVDFVIVYGDLCLLLLLVVGIMLRFDWKWLLYLMVVFVEYIW